MRRRVSSVSTAVAACSREHWLSKLHKHNQIVLSVSDVEALETTARSSVCLASVIDSVIAAIMSELPDEPSNDLRRLVTWLDTIVQDNA